MKKLSRTQSVLFLLTLVLLGGCASYRAMPLDYPCIAVAQNPCYPVSEVMIAAKAFNKLECKRYLDRDVIKKGYLPVQLSIANSSERNYFFSLNRVALPCARPEVVAESVHTSTLARAVGYGTAALFCWPFAIPAVVDSINSAEANDALDFDFCVKAAKDQVISAHSHTNMIVFVPLACFRPTFGMTLIDMQTNQPCDFVVTVAR